jgi:triphosphatase
MNRPHAAAGSALPSIAPRGAAMHSQPEKDRAHVPIEPGKPVKAKPAVLHRGMPVRDAFRAVMQAGLAHLRANEHGMLEARDPEYVHQMRVALRRLRSAVEIFGPLFPAPAVVRAESSIKWLARSLESARDWDVFVGETLPAFRRSHRARRGMAEFAGRCDALRGRAHARAQRAVRSLRYRRLGHQLAALIASGNRPVRLDDTPARAVLTGPVDDFASAILERRHGQVRKKGRQLGGQSSRELHRLRIAIKKYRYAADFFAGLYEAQPARRTLKRLARLQDILGTMNDAATAAGLTAHGFDGATGRQVSELRASLLGWSRGRSATLKRELKGAWKDFRSDGKFW